MRAASPSNGWHLVKDAPLKLFNTFHVDATAAWLLEISDPAALPEALQQPVVSEAALLVLGEGSNVLLAADPDAVVLHFGNRELSVIGHHADHSIVRVGAATPWHELVMWSLQEGLSGLENLALIPGTAGAAPIQNIGAYGSQVGDFVHAVEAFDRQVGEFVRLDQEACQFGYRSSVFKLEPDRYLITALELDLPFLHELKLDYAGIREELAALQVELPEAHDVAQAVINLRQRKLPDPAQLGNAGSFFKNPQLPLEQVETLQQSWPELPVFPADNPDQAKISAAWLIEQCGWKGHRDGDAGVAAQHALVLVNHGQASGAELLALARKIAESVQQRFGVMLEPEPRLIGASW